MCIAHLYDFFPALKFNKAILHQLFNGGNMVRTHFCEKNHEMEYNMIPTCFMVCWQLLKSEGIRVQSSNLFSQKTCEIELVTILKSYYSILASF